MVKKVNVPRETTKSIATLVYPSGPSISLPDEFPSSRHNNYRLALNINVSVSEVLRG
jgi:hypothetical protein